MPSLSQSSDIHLKRQIERKLCNLDGGTSWLRGEKLAEDLVHFVEITKIREVNLCSNLVSFVD